MPILNIYQIYYEFITFKVSRDTLRKSTKPLMVISSIAKLLMAVISSMPIMNSSAFDIGLLSKDNYTGGIDTNSPFGCLGGAVTCVNENKDNNNVIAINGGVTPPSVETAQLLVTKNLKCSC